MSCANIAQINIKHYEAVEMGGNKKSQQYVQKRPDKKSHQAKDNQQQADNSARGKRRAKHKQQRSQPRPHRPIRISRQAVLITAICVSGLMISLASASMNHQNEQMRISRPRSDRSSEEDAAAIVPDVIYPNSTLIPHGGRETFSSSTSGSSSTHHLHFFPSAARGNKISLQEKQRKNHRNLPHSLRDCNYDDIQEERCTVTQLNRKNIGQVKILDFWGEGRIVDKNLVTGFDAAYNVNHQNQKISNGPNKDKSIPNRIPTLNYDVVDVKPFIADHTFQYVTVMGAPVYPKTAQEMYRIARKDNAARIIFYGTESQFTDRLQQASQQDFIFMQHSSDYYINKLEPLLLEPTIRPINLMVPIQLVLTDLQSCLRNQDRVTANAIITDLRIYCENNYARSQFIRSCISALIDDPANPAEVRTILEIQFTRNVSDQQLERRFNLTY